MVSVLDSAMLVRIADLRNFHDLEQGLSKQLLTDSNP